MRRLIHCLVGIGAITAGSFLFYGSAWANGAPGNYEPQIAHVKFTDALSPSNVTMVPIQGNCVGGVSPNGTFRWPYAQAQLNLEMRIPINADGSCARENSFQRYRIVMKFDQALPGGHPWFLGGGTTTFTVWFGQLWSGSRYYVQCEGGTIEPKYRLAHLYDTQGVQVIGNIACEERGQYDLQVYFRRD